MFLKIEMTALVYVYNIEMYTKYTSVYQYIKINLFR